MVEDLKTKLEATTKAHESDKVSAFFPLLHPSNPTASQSRVTNFRAKEREIERLQGQLGTAEFLRTSSEEQVGAFYCNVM